jgi:flagellar motor protein MotB
VKAMSKPSRLMLSCLLALCSQAHAQSVRSVPLGEAVERHLPPDEPLTPWVRDTEDLEPKQGDSFETREIPAEALETVKLTSLVPPIHFQSGVADIPDSTVAQLRDILARMKDRRNVRLHLVGHADNRPLSSALAQVFGDNEGLSRERAGKVAEFLQTALALPPESISYEWAGDAQPVASNDTAEGRALNRRVEVEVWYDKVKAGVVTEEVLVPRQVKRVKVCRMETVCKLRYVEGHARRARVKNLIAPLQYAEDKIDVPDFFIERVRQALSNLADKQNVVVKFIGFTDDTPLTGRMGRIYGTQVGLSKARARRVALAVQDALGLPSAAIDSDGLGAEKPLASNATAQGRSLNRRVEVEFWYDDPLQELPDEPQLCPAAAGAETVTKVYDPPWGELEAVLLDHGQPQIPPNLEANIGRAMADVSDKTNVRVRFVGYTRNERLDRRTALIYGDDIGLSAVRARRTMETVARQMQLDPSQVEYEGRGYLYSDDVVNAGFIQGEQSQVAVQVVYDELAVLDDYDGVDITPLTREIEPKNPFGLNLMRITVDGEPIDDPQRSSADIQRCTDVALQKADIQFGFDDLRADPRLSIAAQPSTIAFTKAGDEIVPDSIVQFSMYDNYSHFIDHAEVRVFDAEESLRAMPLAVVEIDDGGLAQWRPVVEPFEGPVHKLKYVLRAYGADGAFDETAPQSLWLTYATDESGETDVNPADATTERPAGEAGVNEGGASSLRPGNVGDRQLLSAYGENALSVRHIPLSSGTVTVQGSHIPAEHTVWVAGRQVPVDEDGKFVAEAILPTGMHTVEVAVLDPDGNGELFLRDLEMERKDWFYVGMADLTLAQNGGSGPIDSFQGENPAFDYDASSYGRLAFYLNGKFGDKWKLAASADTHEEPLGDLFSNFMNKSPDSLFRRIDPDYHYATFGDDSTVQEGAPTLGRLFVRLSKAQNYGMWGDFKVGYMDNELAQIDRGLYGGTLHYQSSATTSFGEQRFAVDGFAAEPGTVASREEFRGTGGSLYFLRRQDVLTGSERVRIEIRDKASGIVTGVVNLRPVLDYDIDYLQGRLLLSEPLSSTVDDDLLVRSNALSGDEAYLVVRYEYTPGFEDIDALSVGGQVHYWFNDHIKLGVTANANEQGDVDSNLDGADLTLRKSAQTWIKLQTGRSEGFLTATARSNDGGFGFVGEDAVAFASAGAGATRAELSLGLGDFFDAHEGRLTLYNQELEGGYAAPGFTTLTQTRTYGGAFSMPVTDRLSVRAKVDERIQEQGVRTRGQELDIGWQLTENWDLRTGLREDLREDTSAAVALTQERGERRDAVVQVGYDSKAKWRAYGFAQDTLSSTGDREDNGRLGVGGAYRVSDRLGIDLEISDGDLGRGGKVGTSYAYSDRTSLYLNYALENERTDNALREGTGSQSHLVAGAKRRFSDSTSVFLEEKYQQSETMTGLTHSTGVNFSPTKKLSFGANTDIGTLQDPQTGAETQRTAGGVQIGYGVDAVQFSSGVEYRRDETQQPDLTMTSRKTWLIRNDFKFQMTPASRLLGKLNHSESESSQGQFYDGGYTEAVFGFAYRPVRNDRLNALTKYTYFYNVPTTDQVTLKDSLAEFIQKSHIASFDLTYQLKPRWSIGGKYAYRVSEVSLDRENPQFFDNGAQLLVVRADWDFKKDWEATAETRLLNMRDLGEKRTGSLIVVSRYLGTHIKLGVGYNFTDFSDDLTDLSFDHYGTFITLTGAM